MAEFDTVVIGGGHNGLITAAYLLKAGLSTVVVERNPKPGGGVLTGELTLPGFKHDVFSTAHVGIQASPLIANDELGLKKNYGLRYIVPEKIWGSTFPDGSTLLIYRDIERTLASISKLSKRDADAYLKMFNWSRRVMELMGSLTSGPAPSLSGMVSALGQPEGDELLRVAQMSIKGVVDEWFEDDRLKAALARYATEQPCTSPGENGTGLFVLYTVNGARRKSLPAGGSGSLSEALVRFIGDMGGAIMTGKEAKEVLVREGRADGVKLADGTEIQARKAVVADINVKQLLEMTGEEALGAEFATKVRRLSDNNVAALVVHTAMSEPPRYKAEELDGCFSVETELTMERAMRHFEDIGKGIVPKAESASPLLKCNTVLDPTRAPPGKHVGYFYSFMPYRLRDGGSAAWDGIKEEVADSILGDLRAEAPNMTGDKILARKTVSPVDLERLNPSFIKGQINHIPTGIHQMMSLRPFPPWGNFKTPVSHLFLVGPSSATGGGVSGGGRAAANAILGSIGVPSPELIIGRPM